MKKYLILFFGLAITLAISANSPFENSSAEKKKFDGSNDFFSNSDDFIFPKQQKFDPELRNITYEIAPEEVKILALELLKCASDPRALCPDPVLFAGENDVYRKKLAKIIAENADVQFIEINTPFLLGDNKNFSTQTIESLNKILNTKQKVVVSFLGLDCTSDWAHATNYARAVYSILEAFEKNSNITVIGVLDRPDRLPSFLKYKFSSVIYILEDANTTVKQKKDLLHYHLKKFNKECDEKCEESISKLLKTVDSESISGIIAQANRRASLGKEEWHISQKHLEDAIKQYQENQKYFKKK